MRSKSGCVTLAISCLLVGCSTTVQLDEKHYYPDLKTKKVSKASFPRKMAGYRVASFNIIKYKRLIAGTHEFQIHIQSQKGQSPKFKQEDSLTIVLDNTDTITLSSISDGASTKMKEYNSASDVYYNVSESIVKKIVSSNHVAFFVDGKAYDVAGRLGTNELRKFRKVVNS